MIWHEVSLRWEVLGGTPRELSFTLLVTVSIYCTVRVFMSHEGINEDSRGEKICLRHQGRVSFLAMANWVADDISFCALITGKLRVKYRVSNEAYDDYGVCSCANHTSSFIFCLLFLFPLKHSYYLFIYLI